MRIAVLGTVVYDEIITHLGERRESYGGITYNIAALSSLVDSGTELVPIAQVGYDRYEDVLEHYAGYPGASTEGLRRMPDGKNPHVKLVFQSITKRTEEMKFIPPALTAEQIELAAGCDAIMVNFITGLELELDAMQRLSKRAKGHVHLDVHNKITRWLPDGTREFVSVPDWQKWLACFDSVQMNEFEVEHLLGREISGDKGYLDAAAEIAAAGPKAAMLTLGPEGSALAYGTDDGIYGCRWPAADLGEVIDTTGCGDSFSAGFLWFSLKERGMVWANAAANVVGDVNCITRGIGGLDRARDMDALIPQAFGDKAQLLDDGWPGDKLA
jgi:sugar/nucleoside kinase (ribokinase family)